MSKDSECTAPEQSAGDHLGEEARWASGLHLYTAMSLKPANAVWENFSKHFFSQHRKPLQPQLWGGPQSVFPSWLNASASFMAPGLSLGLARWLCWNLITKFLWECRQATGYVIASSFELVRFLQLTPQQEKLWDPDGSESPTLQFL